MNHPEKRMAWFTSETVRQTLTLMARGIERETLRVDRDGRIAKTPHPTALGATLCHESITTDYSEALLELITKPHNSIDQCLQELEHLHGFVQHNLDDEYLWPLSMPPAIAHENDIPIANYGPSVVGLMKHIYRQGLGVRYGRKMQSIAGIHYNLSYPDEFWREYRLAFAPELELQACKNTTYFGLVRAFMEHGWVLTLLTGASPGCHQSFVDDNQVMEKKLVHHRDAYIGKMATSMRMGGLGYHNAAQSDLFGCYDTLDKYTHTLGRALAIEHPAYKQLGLRNATSQRHQLSTSLL